MSTIRTVAYGMLSVCVASVVACGGQDTGAGAGGAAGMGAAPPATVVAAPRAAITSPMEGDSVTGDSVRVMMSVQGAKIMPVNEATSARVPLEGHLHLFLDVDVTPPNVPIPMDNPTAVVHKGNGATEHVFAKLAKGPHRVIVVFAFTDHSADMAVAADTVNFIVR